jgi:gamma-glutamyltranspeptidase/glutathione hydrolase
MNGAVAAGHELTADAGARILAEGGNAVDGCVAAALAAFVVEGPLTGAAGGGFLLHRDPSGAAVVYDCFFAVPSRTAGEMEATVIDFADSSTQIFHVGVGSVAVPGLVKGLETVHEAHGKLPWRELAEPAVELARIGAPLNSAQQFLHEILASILLREEGGRRIFGTRGRVVTDDLVPSLEAIRDEGAAAVHEIVPELAADIERYEVVGRPPVRATFGGAVVEATPAPSRGGRIVAHGLECLGADGLGGLPGSGEAAVSLGRALAAGYGGRPAGGLTGTTHISVVDADLNAAALSSTLGSGSGVFRSGCQLNNMLGELDVIGDAPREPGDRLPSMMTPTLVSEEGRPRLVLGSAGSVRLSGAILQVVAAVVGHGLTVDEAIDRARLHPEGGTMHLEGGIGEAVAEALEADGWELVRWSGRNLFFGGVGAVEIRPDGSFAAAGDSRRCGVGVVVG